MRARNTRYTASQILLPHPLVVVYRCIECLHYWIRGTGESATPELSTLVAVGAHRKKEYVCCLFGKLNLLIDHFSCFEVTLPANVTAPTPFLIALTTIALQL